MSTGARSTTGTASAERKRPASASSHGSGQRARSAKRAGSVGLKRFEGCVPRLPTSPAAFCWRSSPLVNLTPVAGPPRSRAGGGAGDRAMPRLLLLVGVLPIAGCMHAAQPPAAYATLPPPGFAERAERVPVSVHYVDRARLAVACRNVVGGYDPSV